MSPIQLHAMRAWRVLHVHSNPKACPVFRFRCCACARREWRKLLNRKQTSKFSAADELLNKRMVRHER